MLWIPVCCTELVWSALQGLVGGGEGVIRMLRNDTLRYLLESGGFILEEVLQDAGFELKVRFMQLLSCNAVQGLCSY